MLYTTININNDILNVDNYNTNVTLIDINDTCKCYIILSILSSM